MATKFNFNDKRTWHLVANKRNAERIEKNMPKESKKIAAKICEHFGIKV